MIKIQNSSIFPKLPSCPQWWVSSNSQLLPTADLFSVPFVSLVQGCHIGEIHKGDKETLIKYYMSAILGLNFFHVCRKKECHTNEIMHYVAFEYCFFHLAQAFEVYMRYYLYQQFMPLCYFLFYCMDFSKFQFIHQFKAIWIVSIFCNYG